MNIVVTPAGAIDRFQDVNVIIAVGSCDGLLGTAAILRITKIQAIIYFTQAFQVNSINVEGWAPNRVVGFIDLAVDNKRESNTLEFVRRIYALGHRIHFIADEHGKEAWARVLSECDHSVDELSIKPQNRERNFQSSCAIISSALDKDADWTAKQLLNDGDQADQMNFQTYYGNIFNKAIKSTSDCNEATTRRYKLVNHFAANAFPDPEILYWVEQYSVLETNHSIILSNIIHLGSQIFHCDATKVSQYDATEVFFQAYSRGQCVVVLRDMKGVSIGTNRTDIDLLEILKASQVRASGMPKKANIQLMYETTAIEAVRSRLLPTSTTSSST